jgi:hypothetical protein
MLDLAVAYSRYRFLGDEFLTWLWFVIENDQNYIKEIDPQFSELDIGSRIVLENRKTKAVERITIKGDDAGLEEGRLALRKGALLTELSLIYKTTELQWQFTIKGESLNVSNLKTPTPSRPQNSEGMEEFLLKKADEINNILNFIEILYKKFISARVSTNWQAKIIPTIKKWIG